MTKITIFFLIPLLVTIGCSGQHKEFRAISKNWKKDGIGCDSTRQKIVEKDFEILEKNLVGIPVVTAVKYLGEPNEKFNENDTQLYSYFVEPGIQCMPDAEDEIDVFRIALEVRNKKVIGSRKILP